MIIHAKKFSVFLTIAISLAITWFVVFVGHNLNMIARILYPVGCLWLSLFVLTLSLRIDEKGIWALYAFFQKELWVSRIIEWKNIEWVSLRKLTLGYRICVVPKNLNVSIWKSNVIGAASIWFDMEKIVPLLFEHDVTLHPGLLLMMKIEPKDAQAKAEIETYKIEKAKDDKNTLIFNLIFLSISALAGVVYILGDQNGSRALVIVSAVVFVMGFIFSFIFLKKHPAKTE